MSREFLARVQGVGRRKALYIRCVLASYLTKLDSEAGQLSRRWLHL